MPHCGKKKQSKHIKSPHGRLIISILKKHNHALDVSALLYQMIWHLIKLPTKLHEFLLSDFNSFLIRVALWKGTIYFCLCRKAPKADPYLEKNYILTIIYHQYATSWAAHSLQQNVNCLSGFYIRTRKTWGTIISQLCNHLSHGVGQTICFLSDSSGTFISWKIYSISSLALLENRPQKMHGPGWVSFVFRAWQAI